jgi:hypothetical protein
MLDWIAKLQDRLRAQDTVELSIDGQIWTVQHHEGSYFFSNPFGRQEQFHSEQELIDAIQSWYENPVLVVL